VHSTKHRYITSMADALKQDEKLAVTMLLQAGKTINEIAKFAELDVEAVTKLARTLDITPEDAVQRRAKELYTSPDGQSFQEIASKLTEEGLGDSTPMHHLTIASWVKNFGWGWGGSDDGEYAPTRTASSAARSKYLLRMSKELEAELNKKAAINEAAKAAWKELTDESTNVVQLAVIKGAAAANVTDLAAVKKALMASHGDKIRSAKL